MKDDDTKIEGGLSARDRAILSDIEEPAIRAHYEAQLRMAHEWDGVQTAGGIFDTGGAAGRTVLTGLHEEIDPPVVQAQPTPKLSKSAERDMWGPHVVGPDLAARVAIWRGIALVALVALALVFAVMYFGRRP